MPYADVKMLKGIVLRSLAAKLVLKCENCNSEAAFYTSIKVSENRLLQISHSVYASHSAIREMLVSGDFVKIWIHLQLVPTCALTF